MTPPIDTVFELLSDDERRDVCTFLVYRAPDVVSVADIAGELADTEREREQLAIDLHHRHLPKLDDAGLIEYDPRSTTVRYWGQPTLEKWLEHSRYVDERPEPDP